MRDYGGLALSNSHSLKVVSGIFGCSLGGDVLIGRIYEQGELISRLWCVDCSTGST